MASFNGGYFWTKYYFLMVNVFLYEGLCRLGSCVVYGIVGYALVWCMEWYLIFIPIKSLVNNYKDIIKYFFYEIYYIILF